MAETKPYKRNKPNRLKPRFFSTCDVGRIAHQCAVDTGASNIEIMRCVAKALGEDYFAAKVKKQTRAERLKRFGALIFGQGFSAESREEFRSNSVLASFVAPIPTEIGVVEGLVIGFVRRLIATVPLVSSVVVAGIAVAESVVALVEQFIPEYDLVRTNQDEDDDPRNCRCNFNWLGGANGINNGKAKTKGARKETR